MTSPLMSNASADNWLRDLWDRYRNVNMRTNRFAWSMIVSSMKKLKHNAAMATPGL